MSRLQQQVIEFHNAFDLPVENHPVIPDDKAVRLRARLVLEEAFELIESLFGEELVRLTLMEYLLTMDATLLRCKPRVDLYKFADACADLDYVVEGSRLYFGIDGDPVAEEVHRANMAKVGGPRRASDGKVMKPAGWKPPNIEAVLERQRAEGGAVGIARR